jgi:hypothetical protein
MNNNAATELKWCRRARIAMPSFRRLVGRLADCETNSAATVAHLYR